MTAASMYAVSLLLLLAGCGAWAQRQPTEVSTSVVIVNLRDLEADIGGGRSTCETVVWNSRGLNARKINFVPTIISQGTDTTINYYAFSSGYDNSYIQANQDSIRRWQGGLQRCFKAAIDAGFTTIHITPHVDPKNQATGRGLWRNLVGFDPLVKYSGHSYNDVLLAPVANALSAVIRFSTVVEFSVSAEQGLATWVYPKQWSLAMAQTKATTAKGRNATNHLYGVSFNWDKICGCVEPEEPDPIKYNVTYLDRFARFRAKGGLRTIDVEGVKKLLNESDFIGLSAYASLPANLTMPSMEISIETVAFEFQSFGINLRNLLLRSNKRLIYSEQGLGGYKDGQISPNVPTLAKYPFLGRWPHNGYTMGEDPWLKTSFRDYRRRLYDLVSRWGAQGGGPQYRVDGIYLWSVGTWDIHGVHPSAYSSQGSFGDPVIKQTIRAANARAYRKKL